MFTGPYFVQSLLVLFASVTIASVVTPAIYFLFRFLERLNPLSALIVSSIVVVGLLFVTLSDGFIPGRATFFAIGILFGLFGSFLHRRSTAVPAKFSSSWILMSAVSLLSFIVNLVLIGSLALTPYLTAPQLFQNQYFVYSVFVFIMAQSIVTPFLILARKSSRLRPGIDKHLED